MQSQSIQKFLQQLHQPVPNSHKGQNGKALIIGGSDLFHAASRWSFLAASRLTDMTFYSSVAENNQLLYDAKLYGHDGVIVERSELPMYMQEADSILIGPGMRRDVPSRFSSEELQNVHWEQLSPADWENDTRAVTKVLLEMGQEKKWVIDAGALQVAAPEWFPTGSVLTPHAGELKDLAGRVSPEWESFIRHFLVTVLAQFSYQEAQRGAAASAAAPPSATQSLPPEIISPDVFSPEIQQNLFRFSEACHSAVFVLKGPIDCIWNASELVLIKGGNAGMTKGGTGDVLAGSLVGFLATSEPLSAAVVASYLNKLGGHLLFQKGGTMFNSSDLVEILPEAWKQITG